MRVTFTTAFLSKDTAVIPPSNKNKSVFVGKLVQHKAGMWPFHSIRISDFPL